MRRLKLAEVRELMRKANVPTLAFESDQVAAARKRVNPSDPFLGNMATALSLHHWQNTPEDWQRLEAALIVLAHNGARRADEKRLVREPQPRREPRFPSPYKWR